MENYIWKFYLLGHFDTDWYDDNETRRTPSGEFKLKSIMLVIILVVSTSVPEDLYVQYRFHGHMSNATEGT